MRRLGTDLPGEYRAIVRGVYATPGGEPDAYILEMIDRFPGQVDYDCVVMTRACVDSLMDVDVLNQQLIP